MPPVSVFDIGRNDPCWCGSQKKYKRCHIRRQYELPIQPWEYLATVRKAFSKPICLAPNYLLYQCSSNFVKAHTVQKSGSLSAIAEESHVLAFKRTSLDPGDHEPKKVGVNDASTFRGFCGYHDDALFKNIEKHLFFAAPDQCFTLAFRAIAWELYAKMSTSDPEVVSLQRQFDRGRNPVEQRRIQKNIEAWQLGTRLGLQDIKYAKKQYDQLFETGSLGDLKVLAIEFDKAPPIMSSATFFPDQDFDGNQFDDLANPNQRVAPITISSFASDLKGWVVIAWLKGGSSSRDRFVASLDAIDDSEIGIAITKILFEQSENIFIDPRWWRMLSSGTQEELVKRFWRTVGPSYRPPDAYAPGGFIIDEWSVERRIKIGA